MRELGALKTLKTGTLNIAAHESAAVYLLPAPLRSYLTRFPDVRVGIYRSPLAEIPRQVMDREVHVGFVKDEPGFHELQVRRGPRRRDDPGRGAPSSAGRARRTSAFAIWAPSVSSSTICAARTEQKILRLFEQHSTPCHIAAELWSFENIKNFVQAEVGMAIVPRITVAQELRDRTLVQIPVAELNMPRRTLMIYREQGYLSQSARELIKIVRNFNWDAKVTPLRAGGLLRTPRLIVITGDHLMRTPRRTFLKWSAAAGIGAGAVALTDEAAAAQAGTDRPGAQAGGDARADVPASIRALRPMTGGIVPITIERAARAHREGAAADGRAAASTPSSSKAARACSTSPACAGD